MNRFICFDSITVENTPSLEMLMEVELEFPCKDYTPNNPLFKGWQEKAIAWCKANIGDFLFEVEPNVDGDTYGCISYDDGTIPPQSPEYENDPDF